MGEGTISFINLKAAGAALLCLAVASQSASAGAGAIGAANTNRPGITLIHGGGRWEVAEAWAGREAAGVVWA